MQSLALTYRPHGFDDLVGQPVVQVVLRRMVARHRVPQALLFDGPRGTGKTTTARILAAALNCDNVTNATNAAATDAATDDPAVPCGHCVSCKSVFNVTSPDVIEIDAASNGLVEDIRKVREHVLYGHSGAHRVVLFDEAHSCSPAAFNAMLKIFEEPPPTTVFVLLTTEPGRIPDTVLSRCSPFTFRRIGVTDIVDRLTHIAGREHLDVEPALLTAIAERANGGLRDAIMIFDQLTRVGVTTLDAYTALTGDTDFAPAILTALHDGNPAAAYQRIEEQLYRTGNPAVIADALTGVLRDVLILSCGGTPTAQGAALGARRALARHLDAVTTVAAMKTLWDLKTRTRVGDDPRTHLDLAVAVLTHTLAAKTPRPPAHSPVAGLVAGPVAGPAAVAAGRLTLDQMRARVQAPEGTRP
jgi:DNA polymerase-3 subunit gamma/tau